MSKNNPTEEIQNNLFFQLSFNKIILSLQITYLEFYPQLLGIISFLHYIRGNNINKQQYWTQRDRMNLLSHILTIYINTAMRMVWSKVKYLTVNNQIPKHDMSKLTYKLTCVLYKSCNKKWNTKKNWNNINKFFLFWSTILFCRNYQGDAEKITKEWEISWTVIAFILMYFRFKRYSLISSSALNILFNWFLERKL